MNIHRRIWHISLTCSGLSANIVFPISKAKERKEVTSWKTEGYGEQIGEEINLTTDRDSIRVM